MAYMTGKKVAQRFLHNSQLHEGASRRALAVSGLASELVFAVSESDLYAAINAAFEDSMGMILEQTRKRGEGVMVQVKVVLTTMHAGDMAAGAEPADVEDDS